MDVRRGDGDEAGRAADEVEGDGAREIDRGRVGDVRGAGRDARRRTFDDGDDAGVRRAAQAVRGDVHRVDDDAHVGVRRRAGCGGEGVDAGDGGAERAGHVRARGEDGEVQGCDRVQ